MKPRQQIFDRRKHFSQNHFRFTFVIIIVSLLAIPTHSQGSLPKRNDMSNLRHRRYAFATLLCDRSTLPAIQALHASLQKVHPHIPLLVLLPDYVSLSLQDEVSSLIGVHIELSSPPEYPFRVTSGRHRIQKPCRYLKLRLWSLTSWDCLVFLDADTLVLRRIGELFGMPEFSAVKDPVGDDINTGIMVIRPSFITYQLLMKSYQHVSSFNIGDQGTLNTLIRPDTWNELPRKYNTFQSALIPNPEDISQDPLTLDEISILHFSGDTKPWNFWLTSNPTTQISTLAFFTWCKYARKTSDSCIGPKFPHYIIPPPFPSLPSNAPLKTFTVILSTYSRDTYHPLSLYYASIPQITNILVIWHNPNKPLPQIPPPSSKITIFKPNTNTLNNRFLPINLPPHHHNISISSNSILITDDDILIPPIPLLRAFNTHLQNPNTLTGFYPRHWSIDPITNEPSYTSDIRATGYNIILTKAFFTTNYYLYLYTQLLPRRFTSIIDKHNNCEDILFNMMVSGASGLEPIVVVLEKSEGRIVDVGKKDGISSKGGHLGIREWCVGEFVKRGMKREARVNHGSLVI